MNQELKIEHIQIHQNLEIFKGDLESVLMMKPKTMIITAFVISYRLQDNQDQNRHQMALVSDLKLIIWRFVSSRSKDSTIFHKMKLFSDMRDRNNFVPKLNTETV